MCKYLFLPAGQLHCHFSYHTSKSCGNSRTKISSYSFFQQYVARPHTLLYLAVEYSVTRCKCPVVPSSNIGLTEFLVYANSILAMYVEGFWSNTLFWLFFQRFNARHSLTERMNQTIEINLPDSIVSIGPAHTISPNEWHKENTLTNSNTRYSPAVESPIHTHVGANFYKPEPSGGESFSIKR